MLIGREGERGQLDALLKDARLGRGRALILRSSAGIGKTVLLDSAVQQASGFQVLHYTVVESEADLPSAEALTFAARRLTAESLALLFAVREGVGTDLGVPLPTIELEPLEVAASMELLRERFGSTIDTKVARHLAQAT